VHSLVRAALLGEQARSAPGRAALQHARAARWFEVVGEVALSLEHWLLAGDPRSALRLLAARHGPLYDAGGEAIIRHTINAIPDEAATADLESMIEFAWCHLLVNRRRFVELVEQVAWWAEHDGESDAALLGRATVLQSISATVTGRWVAGGRLARQALHEFGDRWWRDPLGRFVWNGVAREIALTESWADGADTVRQAGLALNRDPPRRIALEGTRAVGEVLAGRPVDALRVAAGVRGAVAVENMTILHAELATAEALAHREMGDRSRALVDLEALAEAPAETMLYCKVLATVELAAAHLDAGDLAAARRSFSQAETLIDKESFGPDGRMWLARIGSRMALSGGDIGEIANELYISVNTLKFHLKVIYRKLGVTSRAQAAEVARRPVAAGSDRRGLELRTFAFCRSNSAAESKPRSRRSASSSSCSTGSTTESAQPCCSPPMHGGRASTPINCLRDLPTRCIVALLPGLSRHRSIHRWLRIPALGSSPSRQRDNWGSLIITRRRVRGHHPRQGGQTSLHPFAPRLRSRGRSPMSARWRAGEPMLPTRRRR
jgi:hypothetical protein